MLAVVLLIALPERALARASLLPNPEVLDSGAAASTPAALSLTKAPRAPPRVTAQLLTGVGATVVSVPAGLMIGSWIGGLSNNLAIAAVPSLLFFLLLPPLAVTWTEWLTGNLIEPGSVTAQPAFWVALGAHLLASVGGIAFGVWSFNFGSLAVLTLIEALVLPAAVTLTMSLSRPPPQAPRVTRFEPPLLEGLSSHGVPTPHVPVLPVAAFAF